MTKEQIIILVVSIFLSIILIGVIGYFLIYPLIRKKYMYMNFKYAYYKKIHNIAEINDYILLNGINLRNSDGIIVSKIDHILLGKKYIYIIKDRYYRGAISGLKDDSIWLFFDEKNQRKEISNPMMKNEERIKILSAITKIDSNLCVSIVLINSDCIIKNPEDLNNNNSFIVSSKGLKKLIKTLEKRKVDDIDQSTAEKTMRDIYRVYGKGRENND